MASVATLHPTLISTFCPTWARGFRAVGLVIAGTALLWLSAKIQVPFFPVPMTFQTMVVLVLAMAYGWRLAVVTVLAYLAEGALGLPVFAGTPEKGIGLAYMVGPTGGYLFGFVLAAGLCGALAARGWDRSIFTTALAMVLGNIAIYVPGVIWLGALVGWDKPVLDWGLTPFLFGDVAKIALASLLLPALWKFGQANRSLD